MLSASPLDTNQDPKVIPQTDNFNLQQRREPLSVEYQRWVTDEEPLRNAFYFNFCGWMKVTKTRDYNFLGEKRYEEYEVLEINKEARVMNEALASKLYYDIVPLISKLTTTSFLNKEGIYKSWNATITTTILMLARIARDKDNKYELKRDSIPNIISFLCGFSNMTKKALDGFTTKYNTQSIQTATLIKSGIDLPQPKNDGILDKINIFKK